MKRGLNERERRIKEFRVRRVLDLLQDENLTSNAALNLDSGKGLTFECAFINEIWQDFRIVDRVRQLAAIGIRVEVIEHEHEVGSARFTRPQIRVHF